MFKRPSAAVIPNDAAVQQPARTKSLRDIPFFRDIYVLPAAAAVFLKSFLESVLELVLNLVLR
jgi:hypothetical protein